MCRRKNHAPCWYVNVFSRYAHIRGLVIGKGFNCTHGSLLHGQESTLLWWFSYSCLIPTIWASATWLGTMTNRRPCRHLFWPSPSLIVIAMPTPTGLFNIFISERRVLVRPKKNACLPYYACHPSSTYIVYICVNLYSILSTHPLNQYSSIIPREWCLVLC